jgi:hypothetical protein
MLQKETSSQNQLELQMVGSSIPLDSLTTQQMKPLIQNDMLFLENDAYRGGNSLVGHHKLVFLVAGQTRDVTTASGLSGESIYTKESSHPKAPEVDEFLHTLSDHFDKEPDLPGVMSEAADIFYNLIQLEKLDPEFTSQYECYVSNLATALGLTTVQAHLLALYKYKIRMVDLKGIKDVQWENMHIRKKLLETNDEHPIISIPGDSQLTDAYRSAAIIGKLLEIRIQTLQETEALKMIVASAMGEE